VEIHALEQRKRARQRQGLMRRGPQRTYDRTRPREYDTGALESLLLLFAFEERPGGVAAEPL